MKKVSCFLVAILILFMSQAQYSYEVVNSQQVRKDLGPIATDNNGNTIITGFFTTTLTLGSFTLNNYNGYDQAFVAKKLPNGSFVWAKMLTPLAIGSGNSYSHIYGISTDGAGNIYLTGNFVGKISISNKTVSSTKNGPGYTPDIFTFKLSPDGVALWGNSAGTGNDGCNAGESGTSVTTDNAGNVYVTGRIVAKVFKNTTVCNEIPGGGSCSNATSKSITCPYVVKYNAAGVKIWEKKFLNNGALASTSCWYSHPEGTNIRTDGTDIYVNGYFYGNVNFGAGTLSTGSESISNSFLVKLKSDGTTLWANSVTGNANYPFGVGDDLFVDGNEIYISGIGDNISFGACSLPAGGGPPSFLAKYSSSGFCQWAVKPLGICYGVVKHPNGNLASLVRKGATQPFRCDIKEFSPLDGTAVDSTCFLVADSATGSVTGYPSIAQTPDGFVFSQMVTGTFHFGTLIITASIPKGGGWPDMMLIKYTAPAPPIARQGNFISETSSNKIILYPNPTSNQITLQNSSNKMLGTVSIYDVSGKMIYKKFVASSQITIDVKNFSSGVYYVKTDQFSTMKFIKQ